MNDTKQAALEIFKKANINIPANRKEAFEAFINDGQNIASINTIIQHQAGLMAKWKEKERVAEIMQQPVHMLNATVGKPYETKFDLAKLGWKDIMAFEFSGLEEAGLYFDAKTKQITGTP